MKTYGKLRELIRDKFGTIKNLSDKSGIKRETLNRKLLGKSDWKISEIEKLVDILDIDDVNEYFFYEKSCKIATK